jgi:fructose transport system permease protein
VSQSVDESAGYDAAEEIGDRRTAMQRVQGVLHQSPWISPLIVLILAFIVFSFFNSNYFQPLNLGLIAQQTAITGTLAIGQSLIILTAGIDLSVGAITVFASMVAAKTAAESGFPGPLSILIGIAVGGLAGLLNGLLITRLKLPPFIVTLGTLNVFTAMTLLYTGGKEQRGPDMPSSMLFLGNAIKFGDFAITYGVVVMLILYGAMAYMLRYTAWGRHVYAVGDDPDAARLAGIEVDRVLLSVYVAAGVIYGLGAWVLIGRTGNASPNNDVGINLDTITAAVIGGMSLFGGRGRIVGALIGALIVNAVASGLSLAGLEIAWKVFTIGLLIILAVAADQWIRKAKA